ncbi:MAG TPA: DNA methyltransferase [Chloroflexia bacterium]|nr:DNA methyltransferase [Chloroflexia bacterium]
MLTEAITSIVPATSTSSAATTPQLSRNQPIYDWYVMPEAYSAPLVQEAIREFEVPAGGMVLDPFCGTGTTLVASRPMGRNALGIEVNPFLAFASQVKSGIYDSSLLRLEVTHLLEAARDTFNRMESDGEVQWTLTGDLPQMPRLDRWIARRVVWKVLALKRCIEESVSESVRDVPMLALASILRGASNMKLTPHAFGSREVKQDSPVLTMFETRIQKMLADIEWLEEQEGLGDAHVVEGDIRDISTFAYDGAPVNLAVTSPPYLNNLDYTMQTRLELFFLGFVSDMEELKLLRKRMMICDAKATYKDIEDWKRVQDVASVEGIAKEIDEKLGDRGWGWDYGLMTRQYFGGLLRAMESIKEMLAPGASLLMVLGDSAHSGVHVPVTTIAEELGHIAGFCGSEVRVLRTRRASSHGFKLDESAVVLRR